MKMDKSVKLYDIAAFEDANFWIVKLLPFNENDRKDSDRIIAYQDTCIKNNIFGMGWQYEGIFDKSIELNEDNKKKFLEKYGKADGLEKALNSYIKIKKGDFVLTRLKNSHIYIGRVSEPAKYNSDKVDGAENHLSWYCRVEKWVEFENVTELPSEIIGRLSQRRQPTITSIKNYRQRLLIINAYLSKFEKNDFPKVVISKNNFCRSMEYKQLEDLVCMYIYKRHSGYILLPSSCKVSQQKFEYMFIKNGSKPITCQVKNQSDININEYIGENSFEKIYIFSGQWTDEEVKERQEKLEELSNIEIIAPSELYKSLTDFDYLKERLGDYYDFSNLTIENFEKFTACLNEMGWRKEKKEKKLTGENCYCVTGETIYFNSHHLWYWTEFDTLFRASNDVSFAEAEDIKKLIDEILSSKEYNEV